MTDSGTDSTTLTWSVPECPFTIESSARVLDDIRLAVTDAFFSLPRGGAEIGGVLLGTFDHGRLLISDYVALDCEHAYGPSFQLSPPDEARLNTLLSSHANSPEGLRPVGWYHSHTRSEIFLSDADVAIHNRFFPEPWQVALVMKPHTFQPARIGFFFRQEDGTVHATASYREDALDALPFRQVPAGVPTGPPPDQIPHRSFRPAPVPTPVPESAPMPESAPPVPDLTVPEIVGPEIPAVDLPVPKFATHGASPARHSMVVWIGIVAGLGTLGAAFAVRDMWLPQVLAAIRPVPVVAPPPTVPAPALGLNTIDRDGQLQIAWDRSSPAVRNASDALLEITDGPLPVAIQLDTAHLETGSFTYARTTEKVDVKLIVHRKDGPDVREIASFLGKLPARPPAAEDPLVQTKMKADMSAQAAKTRKLEKEVQSMHEEMRQQQLRRLNNQLPDKN
jgi:proteasome lid subunit RPN8/RPN11